MADAEKAKQLINTTAKLDFMVVSYEKNQDELRKLISEAEKAELVEEVFAAILARSGQSQAPERQRHLLSTIMFPADTHR